MRRSGVFQIAAATATAAMSAARAAGVLTPELLVSAPRPSPAIFNPSGTHAIVPVGVPNLESGKVAKSLRHVNLSAGAWHMRPEPSVFADKSSEGVFLSDSEFAYLDEDSVLCVRSLSGGDARKILAFPTAVSNLKSMRGENTTTLFFSASVYADGELDKVAEHDKSAAADEWKRVRTYDSGFARHWDRWTPLTRSKLFAIELQNDAWTPHGSWRALQSGTPHETPVGPLGDADDFAAAHGLVAYTTKTGDDPTWHTRQDVFVVRLETGERIRATVHTRGWSGAPAIADSDTVFFLQQYRDGYESDRRVIQSYSLSTGVQTEHLGEWDLSPSGIAIARDGALLLLVEEDAQIRVYRARTKIHGGSVTVEAPEPVIHSGAVANVAEAADGALVYTSSSMHHVNDVFVHKNGTERLTNFLHWSPAHSALDLGAEPKRVEFAGADDVTLRGWLLTPPGFDAGKKYPLAVLIHGGPEGAWDNSWSTRWNPAVFAARGFVVVTLDPSGSTGYGTRITERILGHWGDRAYEDIVRGVRHVLDTEKYIDPERVVAAGASFGGYMINWLAGHNEDDLFKAFVTHDGVFDTAATWYATDELYFPEAEFGGRPWDANTTYAVFSPSAHVHKWHTPHLIVHGGRDYRLDESQAISAFNSLQRLGVRSRLLYFPDEGHWVLNPLNSLKWHHEVLGWLAEYAGLSNDENAPAPALVVQ